MLEFEIRRAQMEDADRLAHFLRTMNYFPRLAAQTAEAVQTQVREHLRLCLADGSHSVYLAASPQGEFLGYTAVHWLPYLFLAGPEGYVSELFVADAARGQGIGTQLLASVKQEARERGCSRLCLLNMRDRESYRREFYAKDGWHERADAANFIFDVKAAVPR